MKVYLIVLTVVFGVFAASGSVSKERQTCLALQQVEDLPRALELVRLGMLPTQEFAKKRSDALSDIRRRDLIVGFTEIEKSSIVSLLSAVQREWEASRANFPAWQQSGVLQMPDVALQQLRALKQKHGCYAKDELGSADADEVSVIGVLSVLGVFMILLTLLILHGAFRVVRGRWTTRIPCYLECVLVSQGHYFQTHVLDIGRGGLKLKLMREDMLDEMFDVENVTNFAALEAALSDTSLRKKGVVLHIGDKVLPIELAWRNQSHAGFAFKDLLDEDDVKRLLMTPRKRKSDISPLVICHTVEMEDENKEFSAA